MSHFNRVFILFPILCLYLLAVLFVALRATQPSDRTRMSLRSYDYVEGSIGVVALINDQLHEGDLVVAIENMPMRDWARQSLFMGTGSPGWRIGQILEYTVIRGDETLQASVRLTRYPFEVIFRENPGVALFLMVLQASAFWIYVQRSKKATTQLLLLAASALVTFSICWFFGMDLASFANIKGLWLYYRVITLIMMMTMCSALLHFALVLPSPDTLKRGRRGWMLPAIYLAPYPAYLVFIILTYQADTLEWMRTFELGVQALIFIYFVATLVVMVYDYHKTQNTIKRKSIRAVALTFLTGGFVAMVFGWLPTLINGHPLFGWNTLPLYALPVMIGMGIAVVFYQLFSIRVVIQRTLVWSTLTMLVIATYTVVVGALSSIFRTSESSIIALIGTGLVAVMFAPLREQLQRGVNHLLYGERDDPYGVISRLGARLEATIAPDAVLNTIVETVAQTLRLPYAAIELRQDDAFVTAVSYGHPTHEHIRFPLTDANEVIGFLVVAPRGINELFDAADNRLLKDLTRQARVAVMTVQLTGDLQRSRERLVTAREEERRRLRRDLHDGIGPALASLPLQLDAARNLLKRDPNAADDLLVKLKGHIQTLITDIRRLVYELHPPMLDELGLIPTIRTQIEHFNQINGLRISLEAPETLPPLPAAVEIAAYRITMEALTNVVRHARAKTCQVQVKVKNDLHLTVTDDGCGLSTQHRRGVGLSSMTERAAELGGTCKIEAKPDGGTKVTVQLPVIRKG